MVAESGDPIGGRLAMDAFVSPLASGAPPLSATDTASLTPTRIARLTAAPDAPPPALNALGVDDLIEMAGPRAAALTAPPFDALASPAAADPAPPFLVSVLNATALQSLTPGRIAGLAEDRGAAAPLPSDFGLAELRALVGEAGGRNAPPQAAQLRPVALAALTTRQVLALDAGQTLALDATALSDLTATSLAGFAPVQIGALGTTELDGLHGSSLAALGPVGLVFAHPSRAAFAAALGAQGTVNIAPIGGDAIGLLSGTVLDFLGVAPLGALNASQLDALSAARSDRLDAAAIAAWPPPEAASLGIADRASGFEETMIAELGTEDLAALRRGGGAELTPEQVAALKVTPEDAKNGLRSSAILG